MKFDVSPVVAMVQKWTADLPAKTGKSLDQWAKELKRAGMADASEARAWLKGTHQLGTNTVAFIADYAFNKATWDGDPDSYLKMAKAHVEGQYEGAKAALFPILERLVKDARSFGKDVKVCPCKTMVPFYRKRVFAEVKASTRTRIDLSLALDKKLPAKGVLQRNEKRLKTGDRLTHIIALTGVADITPEVVGWLREAFEYVGEG